MARTSYLTVNPSVIGTVDKIGGPLRRMAEVLANAMQGKLNIGGTITLNGTSTMTLQDPRIGPQSFLMFMATDSAGANVASGIWVASRGKGSAVLDWTGNSSATLEYIVIG